MGTESEATAPDDEPRLDLENAGKAPVPTLEEVRQWDGYVLEDIDGAGVGRVGGCFLDAGSETPAWLLVQLGRFGDTVPIPMHDTAAIAGRVWTPYHRDVLREAPIIDPSRPLNREQELEICRYFGLGESHGRAGQVRGRSEGEVTSQPPPSDGQG